MKTSLTTLLFYLLFSSWFLAMDITSAEYADDTKKTIRINVGGKVNDVTAPEGKFWKNLIVSKNRKVAFFVLNRGDPKRGSWIEDLHRYSADQQDSTPVAIPLNTELKDAKIMEIFDMTDDGSRMLVHLYYSHKKDGNSTFYRTYPYFLDTKDGKLTPVMP